MSTYTVEIQAGSQEGEVWQAMHPAETIEHNGEAHEVAQVSPRTRRSPRAPTGGSPFGTAQTITAVPSPHTSGMPTN